MENEYSYKGSRVVKAADEDAAEDIALNASKSFEIFDNLYPSVEAYDVGEFEVKITATLEGSDSSIDDKIKAFEEASGFSGNLSLEGVCV